jgi:hypothetical protein
VGGGSGKRVAGPGWWGVFGTLLGPEITGPCSAWSSASWCPGLGGWVVRWGCPVGWGACCFWFSRAGRAPWFSFGGVGCAGVMGLLVENCIVDASILKRSNF